MTATQIADLADALSTVLDSARQVDRPAGRSKLTLVFYTQGTLGALVDRWLAAREGDGEWSPASSKRYRRALAKLEALELDGRRVLGCDLEDVTPDWAQRVYDSIARVSVANGRQAQKLLRAAWNDEARHGRASISNPWTTVRTHAEPRRDLYFTADWLPRFCAVVERMVAADELPAYAARFFLVLASSGARPWCELLRLRRRDVDLVGGVILFRRSKGRGRPARSLPLDVLQGRSRRALEAQVELGDEWLWPSPLGNGKPVGASTLQRYWCVVFKACEAAGLVMTRPCGKPVDAYSLRHAAATYWANVCELPHTKVAQLLGHKTTAMIDVYVHLNAATARDAGTRAGQALAEATEAQLGDGDGGGGPGEPPFYGARPAAIKAARMRAKLTQAEFAEHVSTALGRSYKGTAVSAWELGSNPCPCDVLDFLSRISGTPIGVLFGRAS